MSRFIFEIHGQLNMSRIIIFKFFSPVFFLFRNPFLSYIRLQTPVIASQNFWLATSQKWWSIIHIAEIPIDGIRSGWPKYSFTSRIATLARCPDFFNHRGLPIFILWSTLWRSHCCNQWGVTVFQLMVSWLLLMTSIPTLTCSPKASKLVGLGG